jgi:hypothetical protein
MTKVIGGFGIIAGILTLFLVTEPPREIEAQDEDIEIEDAGENYEERIQTMITGQLDVGLNATEIGNAYESQTK